MDYVCTYIAKTKEGAPPASPSSPDGGIDTQCISAKTLPNSELPASEAKHVRTKKRPGCSADKAQPQLTTAQRVCNGQGGVIDTSMRSEGGPWVSPPALSSVFWKVRRHQAGTWVTALHTMLRRAGTRVLEIPYREQRPPEGRPVVLSHGVPYGVYAGDGVAPRLIACGARLPTPGPALPTSCLMQASVLECVVWYSPPARQTRYTRRSLTPS